MMSTIALEMMEGYMPGVQHTIANQRHLLPMGERTDDFHRGRIVSLSVRQSPSEYLGECLSALRAFVLPGRRCGRRLRNKRTAFGSGLAAK